MRILGWLMLALAGTAHAQELVEEQASQCWSPPIGAEDIDFSAEFEVELNKDGKVIDIRTMRYRPAGELSIATVRSASRAIEACAPYQAAGTVTVKMALEPLEPIDPF